MTERRRKKDLVKKRVKKDTVEQLWDMMCGMETDLHHYYDNLVDVCQEVRDGVDEVLMHDMSEEQHRKIMALATWVEEFFSFHNLQKKDPPK